MSNWLKYKNLSSNVLANEKPIAKKPPDDFTLSMTYVFNLSSFYPPCSLQELNKIKTDINVIETLLAMKSSHARPNMSFEQLTDDI